MSDPKQSGSDETSVKPNRFRNTLLWVVATITSAALGALVSSYFERANPTAAITDIGISSKHNERFGKNQVVKIPTGDAVFHHMEESLWTRSAEATTMKLEEVVTLLSENKSTVDELLKSIDAFRLALPELKRLLSAPPGAIAAEMFFDKWQRSHNFIVSAIDGRLRFGEFVGPPAKDYGSQKPYLILTTETMTIEGMQRPVYQVTKRGGKFSSLHHAAKQSQDVAMLTIAKALVFFDQKALQTYLDAVVDETQTYALHEQMQKEIDEYMKGYSRWTVSLLISNTGSHTISFSPTATLYINTRGTSVGSKFTIVDLESRGEDGEPEPVTIAGGESKLITYGSQKLVNADDHWKQLLNLFDSLSRECFVILHPQADLWHKASDLVSPTKVFGPAAGISRLTDKEIELRFKQ